ncbi:AAA family ATPase [Agaribacterium haliotis]|uniref:AAA family ATPase n=1 Tax=Agaribacterium haliotis TaxID=2013869 RepID=UPI000BB54353|nr:ATP-binding protein [Agaribacterium haliotis]
MNKEKGKLSLFCGKMGAGKSTLAKHLASEQGAVLISEDQWLAALYPNQIDSLQDYLACANKLKSPIKTLVQNILVVGTDVVLDFPANTLKQRAWLKTICDEIQAPHCLYYLERDNETCLKQIRHRQQSSQAVTDNEAMFYAVTEYFMAPQAHEGFQLIQV